VGKLPSGRARLPVLGFSEAEPGQTRDNGERIAQEFCDLYAVFDMLQKTGLVNYWGEEFLRLSDIEAKQLKVEKYLLYSKEQGTLTE
jgi:hypothetical protein